MKKKRCRSGLWAMIGLPVLLAAGVMMASAARRGASSKKPDPKIPIHHIILIFQENRSFDSYFGTYPGADGIPMRNGVPTVCVPDPMTGRCVKPYLNHHDVNCGGPHGADNFLGDVANGAMNGFITEAEIAGADCKGQPKGSQFADQVMGYHNGGDIPNYWAYAKNFVLQDHIYESVRSWSFPSHLFMISAWSADCAVVNDPMSCVSSLTPRHRTPGNPTPFAWTDITYLLQKAHVRWAWYLDHGAIPPKFPQPRRPAPVAAGARSLHTSRKTRKAAQGVPPPLNVLPGFTDVHTDHQMANIKTLERYFAAAKAGTLPAVSWILPDGPDSEHPPNKVSVGESYVTRIVNAAMRGPDWKSTVIFITWDDFGGFYDHVLPPRADDLGYGIRVPGLVVSPYAKRGYIDHQTLSFDAYLKFIEDVFLNGRRINPKTDGRPDSRPDVRENNPALGNLMKDFDFSQPPRPPLLLPVHPKTTLVEDQP